jgi:hypothetical protein
MALMMAEVPQGAEDENRAAGKSTKHSAVIR